MGRYRGLIFDFNGVLWWDSALQEKSWSLTAIELRGYPLSEIELANHMHGRTNRYVLEYLNGDALSDDDYLRLMEQKESLYRQLCLDEGERFCLSPGAIKLLDYLDANQVKRTIATASEVNNLLFFFEHLDLERWFEFEKVAYDDGRRPGKPAPHIYLAAARNLGLEPADCVVVEDSLSGLQAAIAAGIGFVIALDPSHTQLHLSKMDGVSLVVDSLAALPAANLFS